MKIRRFHFRLNAEVELERKLIEWLETVSADRAVPLKVHLVPVLAKGLGWSNKPAPGASSGPVIELAARRANPPKSDAAADGKEAAPRPAEDDGEDRGGTEDVLPLHKLEF